MNKIYKVVWSKAKHCYVVTSELANQRLRRPQFAYGHGVIGCGGCIIVHWGGAWVN